MPADFRDPSRRATVADRNAARLDRAAEADLARRGVRLVIRYATSETAEDRDTYREALEALAGEGEHGRLRRWVGRAAERLEGRAKLRALRLRRRYRRRTDRKGD